MSDFLIFIAALVGLALTVLWVLSMLATLRLRDDLVVMRKSVERIVESGQATVLILNERHLWDIHERRRALRLKVLLDHGVEEEDALATVDRELPLG